MFQDGEVTSCDVTTINSLQTVDENSVAKVCSSSLKTTGLEYGHYCKRSAGQTKEREQLQKRGGIRLVLLLQPRVDMLLSVRSGSGAPNTTCSTTTYSLKLWFA